MRTEQVGINSAYWDSLQYDGRFLILYGGAGSGKSHFAAQKLIMRCFAAGERILVVRKVARTLRHSTFALLSQVLMEMNVKDRVEASRGDMTIRFPQTGAEIIHAGLDDVEKLKSIAGVTSIWIEEATEITYKDLEQLNLRLRGAAPTYRQIMISFNPISHLHWLKREFFDNERGNCLIVKTTWRDNPYLDDDYTRELRTLSDPNMKMVYDRGEWGVVTERIIYSNWETTRSMLETEDCLFGIDFGFNSPTAMVQLHRREDTIYVRELIYQSHLTNAELIDLMKEVVPKDWRDYPIICDSAEPDRIRELKHAGFAARPSKKGGGVVSSVNKGIDTVKQYRLVVEQGSDNVIGELYDYSWMVDKDENIIDKPLKVRDHAMDAIRYPVYTVWGPPDMDTTPQFSDYNI